MGMGGVWLFRLKWPARAKWLTLVFVLVVGLGVFGFRFRNYFVAGAASVGARFDYWRAAGQTAIKNPVFGSGPGTFQRPYADLKAPDSEMARLTHNDYLEQFSDSGFVGGVSYTVWIALLLSTLARRAWQTNQPIYFAIFLGVSGWFVQGFSEFSLYVPALAWTAFTLSGCLLGITGNQFDKSATGR
jgi:O-antigen ligase